MAPTTVVVVDQWPLVRMGIGRALPTLSFRVLEELGSAGRARVVIRSRRPALVVLGPHLEEDAAAVTEVARDAGARVVALVDRARRPGLVALARAGADGILAASSTGDEVLAGVRTVLDGGRALSPSLVPALAGVVAPTGGPAAPEGAAELTDRERQILGHLVRGARNREIAEDLFLSPATVKTHLNHIYVKLEVRGRQEAAARALELGLVG
ncbi:MAG TPA: response regulator transcription factor [Acidimicrobiales bacterium]|nr:response regulator transcription factor [Acidimicrobiales bacterium]